MDTIRKKLDVLRRSLNDAEERASFAERELEKSTQRNIEVSTFLSLCVVSFLQVSKIYRKKSSALFFSRKISIMSSNWDDVTPRATELYQQNNFAQFLKTIDVVDNGCCSLQAEKQVSELTTELQKVEDDLDASESRLADVTLQLEQAEQQMDENERYYTIHCCLKYFK